MYIVASGETRFIVERIFVTQSAKMCAMSILRAMHAAHVPPARISSSGRNHLRG